MGLVAVAAMTSACGSSGPAESGAGELRVWALEDQVLNPIEQKSIDSFKAGGGKAKLETFGNDPYKQRLRVAIGSPQAPDLFFNWGGGNLKEYVDAGKVVDLTAALDENKAAKDAFIPSVLDGAKLGGKYYGVPMRGMQPVILFYNKKLFTEAGVQAPATWDQLLAAVDAFKAKGITPIALAGSQAWTELMWAEYVLDRYAGDAVFKNIRDNGAAGWKDPAVVESFQKLKDLIDRGGFGNNFASVGYDVGGASTLLAQGKAAMHLMGSWEYTNQLDQSPDFVKGGDLGWVAFPSIPGGKGDVSNLVGNVSNFYSVTTDSKNVDAAKKFVTTTLHEESYIDALVAAGDVPPVVGAEEKLKKTPNAEYATSVYKMVLDSKNFQLSWDQDLPADDATFMLTQLQEFFLGKVSPQQFVDAVAAR
ncbi:extracellular solute-binding protein [Saccharothrix syringae]|uniref:Extracellular solute-binding protein n=1 Tax=Saccharothrix syringae TaxID=103733 RepID=A0A5Q0GX47_SACSY|nr:extracellular solute-binding protein [Saccharothrix syringae]